MNDEILVPDTLENTSEEIPSIPLHEVVPAFTNYEKLANALRRDIRDASEQLLLLRQVMLASQDGQVRLSQSTIENFAIDTVERALLFLDCTDFIQAVSDEVQS